MRTALLIYHSFYIALCCLWDRIFSSSCSCTVHPCLNGAFYWSWRKTPRSREVHFYKPEDVGSALTSYAMNTSLIFFAPWFLHLEKKFTVFISVLLLKKKKNLRKCKLCLGGDLRKLQQGSREVSTKGRKDGKPVMGTWSRHFPLWARVLSHEGFLVLTTSLRGVPPMDRLAGLFRHHLSSGIGWGLLGWIGAFILREFWPINECEPRRFIHQRILARIWKSAARATVERLGVGLSRLKWWLIQLSKYILGGRQGGGGSYSAPGTLLAKQWDTKMSKKWS